LFNHDRHKADSRNALTTVLFDSTPHTSCQLNDVQRPLRNHAAFAKHPGPRHRLRTVTGFACRSQKRISHKAPDPLPTDRELGIALT